jgi:glycosyltransferase involved in cell wall biosynthesis
MIDQGEAARVMTNVDILINARDPIHEFTKYSFPSKTLEYMLSGTPTLTTRLPGIPGEYLPLLNWIDAPTPAGIAGAVDDLIASPREEVRTRAQMARQFVLERRSPEAQGARIMDFLHSLERVRPRRKTQ